MFCCPVGPGSCGDGYAGMARSEAGDTGPGSVSNGESPADGTVAGPGLTGGATGAGVGAEKVVGPGRGTGNPVRWAAAAQANPATRASDKIGVFSITPFHSPGRRTA